MTGQDIINVAKKYLNYGGSTFNKYCSSSGAWCNAFVSYTMYKVGHKKDWCGGVKTVYCPTSYSWCRKNWKQVASRKGSLANVQAGDVIFFDWNNNGVPDHIGFVRYKGNSSTVYTLEGNTSGGKVAYRTRYKSTVLGVFRPKFVSTKPEVVPAYPSVTLKKNDIGVQVKSLQNCLNKLMGSKLTVDGEFGTKTATAVKSFQKKYKLEVDGIAGSKTNAKIKSLITP